MMFCREIRTDISLIQDVKDFHDRYGKYMKQNFDRKSKIEESDLNVGDSSILYMLTNFTRTKFDLFEIRW